MLNTAIKTATAMGYGPNYTVFGINMWSKVQSKIAEAIDQAMQGYQPAAHPAQGPPAPVYAPGRQGALDQPFRVADTDRADTEQASLPSSLLSMLSQLNPISTAEARGVRGPSRDEIAAIELAREGGSMGGQPGRSVVGSKIFTFYAPGASGAKGTEGPMIGSRANALTTLDDIRSGRADVVSLAGHPSQFGQTMFIGNITYTSPIDGKTYTLNNVMGRVDDTGGEFRGNANPDLNQFDIAVGNFGKGWNDTSAGKFVATNYVTANPGRGIGSDVATSPDVSSPAVAATPQAEPVEARAEGGPVKKGKPYLVGEEGPEVIVPDEPGTVLAHMPQPGRGDPRIGRWPKVTAPDYPGRYRGLEGGIKQAIRNAQDPAPTLMDMVDSGQLRLNANWQRMLNDPALIALGQSRMRDITQPGDYEAPEVPAIDQSPNELSRQLGYDAIRRPSRRVIIGNKSY
jgi:hypothetical protein